MIILEIFSQHTELHIPIILGHHQACETLQSSIISYILTSLLVFSVLIPLSVFIPFSVRILYEANNIKTHSNCL